MYNPYAQALQIETLYMAPIFRLPRYMSALGYFNPLANLTHRPFQLAGNFNPLAILTRWSYHVRCSLIDIALSRRERFDVHFDALLRCLV